MPQKVVNGVEPMDKDIEYKFIDPAPSLADFVESFWMLRSHSNLNKDIVVVPDGRVDLFFSYAATEPFHTTLMGLESEPTQTLLPPKIVMYAISFKPLAVEYVLHTSISDILDKARMLPANFWEITKDDLHEFDIFCKKVSRKIEAVIDMHVDSRKRKLFDLIYSSNGSLTVKELSEKVCWSSRQINRYFNQQFGISLKTYCKVIRFRASFKHIAAGKLFPEQSFTDQPHFIKEIKKLSGVKPKDLFRNQNDRFLQFSPFRKK